MRPVKSPFLKLLRLDNRPLAVAIALFAGVASGAPLVSAPQEKVDAVVLKKLQELGIQPSEICSDEVFVRRVFLDVIGTLPSAQEVRDFLADQRSTKREALIDQLLTRDAFADYWAMKWCDLLRVKSEFPINLWPNAVQAYHRWIRTSIKQNMPYDRFARELLTSNGSNFRVPQVNFYRAVQNKTPKSLAQIVALTFMGTRTERWPEAKQEGMAGFFSQVGYKATSEWKEEIIYFDPSSSNALMSATFPDGTAVEFAPDQDPRDVFATWLVRSDNPWFTKCIANRAWSWFMGHGIIDEPDDIRPDNPPVNVELLAHLESELLAGRYDILRLFAMILKSKTYQRSCIPKSNKPEAERNFAFYPVRRLEAEVLIDALNQITGGTEKYTSAIPEPFSYIPENLRTITLADGSISSPFLGLYGRSARDTGLERERINEPNASQRLHLLNSSHIQHKLEKGHKLMTLFMAERKRPFEKLDELYLTILSRYPTAEEVKTLTEYGQTVTERKRLARDMVWALVNTAEFQCRH